MEEMLFLFIAYRIAEHAILTVEYST